MRTGGWTRRRGLWLPRSGQTASYPNGDATDRDDGHYQAGWPGTTRFVDNGDGTVYDRATGLTWVQEPGVLGGVFGSAGSPGSMPWLTALAQCEALDYAGHTDWRLPNVEELHSLRDYGVTGTPIDVLFPDTQAARYWSSTTQDSASTSAWTVVFIDEYRAVASAGKGVYYYVRPVRGGRING